MNCLAALVRRDSDTKQDYIKIDKNDFIADYGFNVWHHYVITYRSVAILVLHRYPSLSIYV